MALLELNTSWLRFRSKARFASLLTFQMVFSILFIFSSLFLISHYQNGHPIGSGLQTQLEWQVLNVLLIIQVVLFALLLNKKRLQLSVSTRNLWAIAVFSLLSIILGFLEWREAIVSFDLGFFVLYGSIQIPFAPEYFILLFLSSLLSALIIMTEVWKIRSTHGISLRTVVKRQIGLSISIISGIIYAVEKIVITVTPISESKFIRYDIVYRIVIVSQIGLFLTILFILGDRRFKGLYQNKLATLVGSLGILSIFAPTILDLPSFIFAAAGTYLFYETAFVASIIVTIGISLGTIIAFRSVKSAKL